MEYMQVRLIMSKVPVMQGANLGMLEYLMVPLLSAPQSYTASCDVLALLASYTHH